MDTAHPRQPPAGTRLSGLMILNLPADATPAAVEKAPPLGRREQVGALLAELLPGAQFDEFGCVRFFRDDYTIEIELADGDPVHTATLHLTGQPSIVPARRLLRRTGWRLFSPKRGEFVEPEVLGRALAESSEGGLPEALQVPSAPLVSDRPWEATAESARRYSRLGVGLLALLAVGAAGWWTARTDPIEMNERQTVAELAALGQANLSLRAATGAYTSPEQLADPGNAARLGGSALPPLFTTRVRHGYRFEFSGEPLSEADLAGGRVFAVFDPSYSSYVYVALPIEPGRTGRRSFAYHSEKTSIYARDGLGIPTPDDERISSGR